MHVCMEYAFRVYKISDKDTEKRESWSERVARFVAASMHILYCEWTPQVSATFIQMKNSAQRQLNF